MVGTVPFLLLPPGFDNILTLLTGLYLKLVYYKEMRNRKRTQG